MCKPKMCIKILTSGFKSTSVQTCTEIYITGIRLLLDTYNKLEVKILYTQYVPKRIVYSQVKAAVYKFLA